MLSAAVRTLEQHTAVRSDKGKQQTSKLHDKLVERVSGATVFETRSKLTDGKDLLFSVLSATTTKRDARSYIARFKPSASKNEKPEHSTGKKVPLAEPIRVALVKLRAPQHLADSVIQGLAHTLSQLARLGLRCIIVLDCEEDLGHVAPTTWREDATREADRIVAALDKEANVTARRLDYALGVVRSRSGTSDVTPSQPRLYLQYSDLMLGMLENGTIPVIPAVGYTSDSQQAVPIPPDDIMLALTQHFANTPPGEPPSDVVQTPDAADSAAITIERVILLDPLGGLPSAVRHDKSHIFVNVAQEYSDVRQELLSANAEQTPDTAAIEQKNPNASFSLLGASNPFTSFLDDEKPNHVLTNEYTQASNTTPATNRNVRNLDLLQQTLKLLPTSSSALLTTPLEAATLSTTEVADVGVLTRRPKNPLIFNLLTDKPIVSSSLPELRVSSSTDTTRIKAIQPNTATFFKLGMPLTVTPDPRVTIWHAPGSGHPALSLESIGMDLARLVHLIEDSFGRPLDTEHYLNRIRGKLAGVIIAGDYEGGAILTWELPPGVPDDGNEESRQRMVPYLDKFAVLKRSQGSGGVADIVFSSMVRSCFPHGVCWRSRKDNPVNKWYFERSTGTWKLSDSNWTMFWTTTQLFKDKQRFHDYEGVCRSVPPSWADTRKVVD